MAQQVAVVTEQDIERLVARDFPCHRHSDIHLLLRDYGSQSWHTETLRVRAGVLKIAAGDEFRLRSALELASTDYRDVLAGAEYPEMCRAGFDARKEPTSGQLAEIEARDRQQYRDWFER